MEIHLLESAKEDLREGRRFYDRQTQGLGDHFLDSINADVKRLPQFAGAHKVVDGFHRMLARRFPFAVYCLVENEQIKVYAVLDYRRDPEWIIKRLKSSRDE